MFYHQAGQGYAVLLQNESGRKRKSGLSRTDRVLMADLLGIKASCSGEKLFILELRSEVVVHSATSNHPDIAATLRD